MRDIRRVDEWLMALFRDLGERWGRVTREGIHVPLPLTQVLIAELIGVPRRTVTP